MLTKLLIRFDPEQYRVHESAAGLVYRLLNPLGFVAFKMGRWSGLGRTKPKGFRRRYTSQRLPSVSTCEICGL